MQSESSHYINSVSDLYGTDEIDFLLDDIRDLEPSSCRPEDIQDFEIAGSRTGGNLSTDCAGGCECESPLGTVNSWDSHSHYRRRAASPDLSLYSGVIVYCDHTHLKTPTGVIRVLLVISTVACLTCLCTSGTVKVGLFMLPLVSRVRLMLFVALLSLLVTCLLLFLDVSHMIYLFPFNWGKVNAYLYVSLSILFLVASSLIFHMIFLSEAFMWVPKWTHQQLLVTGCLGYVCCLESIVLSIIQKCNVAHYEPVTDDAAFNLHVGHDGEGVGTPPHRYSPKLEVNQTATYNYKSNFNYPNVVPSTSKQLEPTMIYLDDVQPCSSKSVDNNYRMA